MSKNEREKVLKILASRKCQKGVEWRKGETYDFAGKPMTVLMALAQITAYGSARARYAIKSQNIGISSAVGGGVMARIGQEAVTAEKLLEQEDVARLDAAECLLRKLDELGLEVRLKTSEDVKRDLLDRLYKLSVNDATVRAMMFSIESSMDFDEAVVKTVEDLSEEKERLRLMAGQ